MAAALHSCLELILWAGCSERVSGLLLVAWDQTVTLKNSIFSQVSSGDAHAPSCSPGTAEHGWEQCQCAPRADGQLLQLQGQLFWFSSPSSFREPRSLATMGSSLSRSSFFFLFEQGAEMLGETVGQGSAHSSAQAFSIKTTGKSHSLGDKLGSMVSAPPDQAVLQWDVG